MKTSPKCLKITAAVAERKIKMYTFQYQCTPLVFYGPVPHGVVHGTCLTEQPRPNLPPTPILTAIVDQSYQLSLLARDTWTGGRDTKT